MNQTLHNHSEKINDYLDLLNYAKQMGDTAWQEDIVEILSKLISPEDSIEPSGTNEELWERFDQINSTMLELYMSIRETSDEDHKQQLLEQMWELKLERISISRQIKNDYFSLEELWFEE
ncbi:hypothetical protein [Paenibacillus segetis]|uniref:Uncharacterized protein n=1 Tax=Paenibacillus segetis TaxID=1325360 RepID=A0ABQ1Y9M3_9BACL|nr:hypothetical protein [Paenibacillus segetis]GGH16556.1 hypothetical protein GCM10008013_11400 [Paenibacillus segetis]